MTRIKITKEVLTHYGVLEITFDKPDSDMIKYPELTFKRTAVDYQDSEQEVSLQIDDEILDNIIKTLEELREKSK